MAWKLLLFSFLLVYFQVCDGGGTLQIQLVKYVRQTEFGCESDFSGHCNPVFKICFKYLKPTGWNKDGCKTSKAYSNKQEITFGNDIKGIHNPIKIPVTSPIQTRASVNVSVTQAGGFSTFESTLGKYVLNIRGKANSTGKLYTITDDNHEHSTLTIKLKLTCNDDYYGTDCDVHCPAPRPTDHYTCNSTTGHKQCKPGYTGNSCTKQSTLLCECKNGGKCLSHVCQCLPGFTGQHCEITGCDNSTCRNGGKCRIKQNNYTCECEKRYTGKNCETHISQCLPNTCKHNGTCIDGDGIYLCDCKHGYTGRNCETNINECASHPCLNHGTCTDGVGTYSCHCKHGFTGKHCEANINECASNPCLNYGTCTDGVGSYSCRCKQGYTGTNCETDINECASHPCLNNGTCVDEVDRYSCKCRIGYRGENCESECSSNRCRDTRNNTSTSSTPGYSETTDSTKLSEIINLLAKLYLNETKEKVDESKLKASIQKLLSRHLGSNKAKYLNFSLTMKEVSGQNGEQVTEVSINFQSSTKVINSKHLSKALNDITKPGNTLPYKMYDGNVRSSAQETNTTNNKYQVIVVGLGSALGVLVIVIIVYCCQRRGTSESGVRINNNFTIDDKFLQRRKQNMSANEFENLLFESKEEV